MSFLVPSVLWGLIAATIPLLIHLFSIRRTQTVDFSSIQFIKELEHETIRRLKIRQLILLILRTLAIVLIVLSFARPVKLGYFPVGSSQSTQMIFLVDNSASMSASNEDDKLLLTMAKEKVKEILKTVEGEMHLQLWQTNPLKRIFSGEFNSVDVVAGYLESIHESAGDDELWNAIEAAISDNVKTRIVVEGEEDLATLAAISLANLGAKVIYGMPDKGMVVVDVNQRSKKRANSFLERMLVK